MFKTVLMRLQQRSQGLEQADGDASYLLVDVGDQWRRLFDAGMKGVELKSRSHPPWQGERQQARAAGPDDGCRCEVVVAGARRR